MIVLSYLWLLALVPFLVEKEDAEVQWHAKHGLVLLAAEILIFLVVSVFGSITGFVTCLLLPLLYLAIFVLHGACIVKGVNGERLTVPVVSEYADRF